MKLSDGIRKHGFRKWYERELLQSHAHLALCFLSCVGLFAAFDGGSAPRTPDARITDALSILLCAAVGIWSLRRYLYLLTHAEAMANQADCPQCNAYARFNVLAEKGPALRVRCKKCEHEWQISD